MKTMSMKKWMALFLVLLLAMTAMVGCGGEDEPQGGDVEGNEGDVTGDTSLQDVLDAGEITCAISPDYAPYEYLDLTTGEVKGSDVKLAQYIADQLGVKLKIEQMSFESCLAAVQSGSVDISTSCLSWDEDRAELMNLSTYYNMDSAHAQTILVMAENADQYKTAEDFKGLKIAAQNGTTQWEMTTTQIPDVKATAISQMNDGLLMLMEGKVDGMATPVDVAKSYVENYPELAIPEFLFDNEEIGNVVATAKGNDALMEKINEIVDQLEGDGMYTQWLAEATEDAAAQGLLN